MFDFLGIDIDNQGGAVGLAISCAPRLRFRTFQRRRAVQLGAKVRGRPGRI
jgi:hypothetical protein